MTAASDYNKADDRKPFGVVLNYFSTEDIPHLRASLLFAATLSLREPLVREVVVVDGSPLRDDRLREEVERLGAIYRHEGRVLGFAEGYNVGARLTTAPWIVLSASDIYPALDFYSAVDTLIREAGPAIGCIIPRLTKADLPIQESNHAADFICAVPLMTLNLNVFERQAFIGFGGVPEGYSGAYNDVEMSIRIREQGKLILMLPTKCSHFGRLTWASAASNYRYNKDRDVFYSRFPQLARIGSFWDVDVAKICGGRLGIALRIAGLLSPRSKRLDVLMWVLQRAPSLTKWKRSGVAPG